MTPRNLAIPPEKYTCVCMLPDYVSDGPEFHRVWVKATDIFKAQERAQKITARRIRTIDDPFDVAVVAVYAGHIEDIGV